MQLTTGMGTMIKHIQDNSFKVISFMDLNDAIKLAYSMGALWEQDATIDSIP
jgi:hypothetical protein